MNAPKLVRVVRLDSMPIKAQFTPEGYLTDKPILTSTGIFEYHNDDGSIRRELRLPDDVFDVESLASYKGKPIVITHDAGLITKDNVQDNQIGTILTEGEKSGNDVRAEIIIHDADKMKSCGLKELSLGYDLDLEEMPGYWHGEHYDAIQRNIRINHLALVREARAGDQARLNLDGRANKTLIGGKLEMAKKTTTKHSLRADSVLPPEELEKAIAEYKKRRAASPENSDEGEEAEKKPEQVVQQETVPATEEKPDVVDEDEVVEEPEEMKDNLEDRVNKVKERRDIRDEKGDPKNKMEAMTTIAEQDEDLGYLFDIIDSLLAEREFKASNTDACKKDEDDFVEEEEKEIVEDECEEKEEMDSEEEELEGTHEPEGDFWGEEEEKTDEDEFESSEDDEEEETAMDEDEDVDDEDMGTALKKGQVNEDSIDAIVRKRIELGTIGKSLNLDGLENMKIKSAKKAIIKAVRPNVRLDGKSDTYINAMYALAVDDVKSRNKKDTSYQKRQMFNADSKTRNAKTSDEGSAAEARRRMIERKFNTTKED